MYKNILFYSNIITSYKNNFLNSLRNYCKFNVLLSSGKSKRRNSSLVDFNKNYKVKVMKSFKIKINSLPKFLRKDTRENYTIQFSPRIFFQLLKLHNDFIMYGPYTEINSWIICFYCKLFNVKNLLFVDTHFGCESKQNKIKTIIKKNIINNTDKFIVPSSKSKIWLNEKYQIKNDNILIYPMANFDTIKNLKIEKYKNIFNILFVGEITNNKNLLDLLKACTNLANVKIYVAGKIIEPDYYNVCVNYIKKNKINVCFLGHLNKKKLEEYYIESHLLVNCSVSETVGYVLYEALNYYKPLIITKNVGCSLDVVEEGLNGEIYDVYDYKKLKEKIKKIKKNHFEYCLGSQKKFLSLKEKFRPRKVIEFILK